MGDLLVAIALLCQVHGGETRNILYSDIKDRQKTCQQKLVNCLTKDGDLATAKRLATCIKEGDY